MEILVVGNYCHDTVIRADRTFSLLGGSASYISAALSATDLTFKIVAKVGKDFLYASQIYQRPIVSEMHPTAHFLDQVYPDRTTSQLTVTCEPIRAQDIETALSGTRAKIGMACGVALEILPQTLTAMRKQVDFLMCDAQGLLRIIDSEKQVQLTPLSQTDFAILISEIDFLKMNAKEFKFVDLPRPKGKTWVVTRGEHGTVIMTDSGDTIIPPLISQETDPTGAGDSFMAGVAIGLSAGKPLEEAVRLGNEYGAFAVQSMGIPDFRKFRVTP